MTIRSYTIVLLFGVSAAFGQTDAKAEQEVMRIEKEMLNAILKGDASANERYAAPTATFTAPDGSLATKAQLTSDISSGTLKLQAASLDNAKVQVYGDTAIVTYTSNDKGTYKGRDISGRSRWTDVFIRRQGQWQLVAAHGSIVAKQ